MVESWLIPGRLGRSAHGVGNLLPGVAEHLVCLLSEVCFRRMDALKWHSVCVSACAAYSAARLPSSVPVKPDDWNLPWLAGCP